MEPKDLKPWREQRGWTEQQAARYVGTRQATYKNWELGTRKPPAMLWRLINVLGTVELLAPAIHATMLPGDDRRPGRKAAYNADPIVTGS